MTGLEMEVVRQFNSELSSLYESKPPVSKAKMATITRVAIKAIKYYKHVVHSVEKFIQKCRPEYKLPGLYVIDSIVRQSRHQFGSDRDLYGPRFGKNFKTTFQSIYGCAEEEKARVLRVLNLWQKNNVFTPAVIQPLIDLASGSKPETAAAQETKTPAQAEYLSYLEQQRLQQDQQIQQLQQQLQQQAMQQQAMQQQLQQQQQLHQQQVKVEMPVGGNDNSSQDSSSSSQFQLNPSLLSQIQALTTQLKTTESPATTTTPTAAIPARMDGGHSLVTNNQDVGPGEQGFKQLSDGMPPSQPVVAERGGWQPVGQLEAQYAGNNHHPQYPPQASYPSDNQTENTAVSSSPKFNQALLSGFDYGDDQDDEQRFAEQRRHLLEAESRLRSSQGPGNDSYPSHEQEDSANAEQRLQPDRQYEERDHRHGDYPRGSPRGMYNERERESRGGHDDRSLGPDARERDEDRSFGMEQRQEQRGENEDRRRRSRWGRDDSPSLDSRRDQRMRGNDSPRQRSERSRRSRSRSPLSSEREAERAKREERRKLGFPPIRKEHMSLCSVTIWIGHLSKSTGAHHLENAFAEFGEVGSIDLVQARGCAFVIMKNRADANAALENLRNRRINGNTIKISWAPGKAIKGTEYKKHWDEERGVTYLPWSKVKADKINELSEGAIIDPETVPKELTDEFGKDANKEADNPETVATEPQNLLPPSEATNPMPAVSGAVGLPPMFHPGQAMVPPPGMLPGMPPHSFPPGFRPPPFMPPGGFRPGMVPPRMPLPMLPPRFPPEAHLAGTSGEQQPTRPTAADSQMETVSREDAPSNGSADPPSSDSQEPGRGTMDPTFSKGTGPHALLDGMPRPRGPHDQFPHRGHPLRQPPPWMDAPHGHERDAWPRGRMPMPPRPPQRMLEEMHHRSENPQQFPWGPRPSFPPRAMFPGAHEMMRQGQRPFGMERMEGVGIQHNLMQQQQQPRNATPPVHVPLNPMMRPAFGRAPSPDEQPEDQQLQQPRQSNSNGEEDNPAGIFEAQSPMRDGDQRQLSRDDDRSRSHGEDERNDNYRNNEPRRDDRYSRERERDGRDRQRPPFNDRDNRERDRDRHDTRDRMPGRYGDRDRGSARRDRGRFRDRSNERSRDRSRDRSRERIRDRSRDRDRRRSGRDDDRGRGRSQDRRRDRYDDRSRRRSRERSRSRDRRRRRSDEEGSVTRDDKSPSAGSDRDQQNRTETTQETPNEDSNETIETTNTTHERETVDEPLPGATEEQHENVPVTLQKDADVAQTEIVEGSIKSQQSVDVAERQNDENIDEPSIVEPSLAPQADDDHEKVDNSDIQDTDNDNIAVPDEVPGENTAEEALAE